MGRGKSNIRNPRYRDFCNTDAQRAAMDLWLRGLTFQDVGKELGISVGAAKDRVQNAINRAHAKGMDPRKDYSEHIPDGHKLKGISVLHDTQAGQDRLVWIKTDQDKEQLEQKFREFIESLCEQVKKYKVPKIKPPKVSDKDLLALYPMGDPHIGMYAWALETGTDFDCDIAERNLRASVNHLVDRMPPAETAIILNLGDFFHSDNQSNRTARAGNALDVDTRWARVLDIGIALMVDLVNLALQKHKKVIVKNNIGNHDDHTSQVLSICLSYTFKDNPRVEIAAPMDPFFAFQFHNVSIFSTHGHMVKPPKMQGVISNYYPEMWGSTEHRHCHVGHFHHQQVLEDNGLVTEIHNTLAATDAWHTASGYRSKRRMCAIAYHKDDGEIERFTYNIRRSTISE